MRLRCANRAIDHSRNCFAFLERGRASLIDGWQHAAPVRAIGGTPNGTTVQIYDPVTNKWSYGPSLFQSVIDATAVVDKTGRIYVIGGFGPGEARVQTTIDNADVTAIARRLADAPGAPVAGATERWEDRGYWLAPLIALIGLLWFRRGWVLAT